MDLQQRGGGGGLWLQTQEGQDLCAVATTEQPMLKTSSEHRTVDLENKCMTKDFLSGFHHGFKCMENKRTVRLTCSCKCTREGTELWEYMWGRVCREESKRKTQCNLVCLGFRGVTVMGVEKHWYWDWETSLSSKNDVFACMVIVTYEFPYTHNKDTNIYRQNRCFWFLVVDHDKPFSRTLKDKTDLFEFDPRIFLV